MEEKTFFKGEWKSEKILGEGSFGTVYQAVKEQYGIKSYSAIKQIIIPQSERDYSRLKSEGMSVNDIEKSYDSQVRKWVEEIQFLNQFKDDENIVSIEDFEVLERTDRPGRIINIRMELLQNIDDHVLDKMTTDKKVLKMASDILKALEDCEEKNVVHRDIKPENVFVNSRGLYKLGDFGEAKSIEKTVSNMSKKGTENYMAPEIYKGERGSRSVDTYSLGIMLYKYYNNNRLPFIPDYPNQITFEDRETALYKRMSGEKMKPPVKATSNIARIILKACSYDPKDRYGSANEFRNDIENELKSIVTPIKLFDFQEGEIQKEFSIEESKFDKTESIFSDNTTSKFDKTVGIFSDENDRLFVDENEKIDNTIGEKIEDTSISNDEKEKNKYIEENLEDNTKKEDINLDENKKEKDTEKKGGKKKVAIYIGIAAIVILIVVGIVFGVKSLLTDPTVYKVTRENLSMNIPYSFQPFSESGYLLKTQNTIGDGAEFELQYIVTIFSSDIHNENNGSHSDASYYLEREKTDTEGYTFGEIEDNIKINGNYWKKMRVTYEDKAVISTFDYYAIVFEGKVYFIRFECLGYLPEEELKEEELKQKIEEIKQATDMTTFVRIINSLSLSKRISKTKVFEELKIDIPDKYKTEGIGQYLIEEQGTNVTHTKYALISVYGEIYEYTVEDFIKSQKEYDLSKAETVTYEDVEKEKINNVQWKILKRKEKDDEFQAISYYYMTSYNDNLYVVQFTVYDKGSNITKELNEDEVKEMANEIKNTMKFVNKW